jgi:hypothetical protein
MKNTLKQQDSFAVATYRTGVSQPVSPVDPSNPDEMDLLQEKVFTEKHAPRMPEPQEEESFRALLKAHLPRHKAPEALMQRIRNNMSIPK